MPRFKKNGNPGHANVETCPFFSHPADTTPRKKAFNCHACTLNGRNGGNSRL